MIAEDFLKSKGLHVHEVNNLYKEYYSPLWSYKSINGLIDDWLIDWLVDWYINWLIDWLIDLCLTSTLAIFKQ